MVKVVGSTMAADVTRLAGSAGSTAAPRRGAARTRRRTLAAAGCGGTRQRRPLAGRRTDGAAGAATSPSAPLYISSMLAPACSRCRAVEACSAAICCCGVMPGCTSVRSGAFRSFSSTEMIAPMPSIGGMACAAAQAGGGSAAAAGAQRVRVIGRRAGGGSATRLRVVGWPRLRLPAATGRRARASTAAASGDGW